MDEDEDSKKNGEQEVEDVRKKIEENANQGKTKESYMPDDCGQITYVNRYDEKQPLNINHRFAKGLNRILKSYNQGIELNYMKVVNH